MARELADEIRAIRDVLARSRTYGGLGSDDSQKEAAPMGGVVEVFVLIVALGGIARL